jgi:hypothetical protein
VYKNYFEELNPTYTDEFFDLQFARDPGLCSEELYKDIERTFFGGGVFPNGNRFISELKSHLIPGGGGVRYYEIVLTVCAGESLETVLLTADYIGPSVEWARKASVSERKIKAFLGTACTLGGYMPCPQTESTVPGIKQARDDERNGYCGRFDMMLKAIKNYYAGERSKIFPSLDLNGFWFRQFVSFDKFCEYFKLNDFIDDNGEVKDLTSFDGAGFAPIENEDIAFFKMTPKTPETYQSYIDCTNEIISKRNLSLGL